VKGKSDNMLLNDEFVCGGNRSDILNFIYLSGSAVVFQYFHIM